MALVAASIQGGTNQTGVSRNAFAAPRGMSMRYDLPSARLRPFISAYVVHAAIGKKPWSEWFLPTDAMVNVQLDGAATTLRTLEGRFDLPPASIVGPTSRAFLATVNCGIWISIKIKALGWMALTERSAEAFRDRAVNAKDLTSERFVDRLMSQLHGIRDESLLASALDGVLEPLFCHGEEPAFNVEAIREALTVGYEVPIADVASSLGVSGRTLLTLSKIAFGMTPKLLFRRERFLQAFRELLMPGDNITNTAASSRYFDGSHFLRDATDFLGTTPRRFIAGGTTLQRAILVAEQAVLTGRAAAK